MATIRQVAEKANVAACTVSRVLNNSANVAPETRRKIEQAMEELNYIPNELARGMFKQKSNTVAMLIPSIKHPYFSSLAQVIESELYKKGYKFMLCSTDGHIQREKEYLNILKSNIVDGIILGVSDLDDSEYLNINKPMIMLDYDIGEKVPIVVSDHENGGRLAAEEFIKSDCEYVIHIGDSKMAKVESYKYHKALEEELNKHNIGNRFVKIKWNEFDFKGYIDVAKTILLEYPYIDGILAADIQVAAFLKAAINLNKKIPDDLVAVSYDGTYVSNLSLIEVTSIVQSTDKIGKKTVELISQLMAGKKLNNQKYLIDVYKKNGDTTK